MKKLFKSMLFSLLVISSTTSLTSCLGFFEEEVLQISSIQTIELENGDIQVFIIYSDEEIAPTTFVVPKVMLVKMEKMAMELKKSLMN